MNRLRRPVTKQEGRSHSTTAEPKRILALDRRARSPFHPRADYMARSDFPVRAGPILLGFLKLPRFGGHPNICVPGVHDVEDETTLYA